MINFIFVSFSNRFQDFRNDQEMMILHPLKCDLKLIDFKTFLGIGISIADLQMEIQNKSIWLQKLQEMVAHVKKMRQLYVGNTTGYI